MIEKLKIAIVTHNLIRGDGQGRVNYETARHLLQQGSRLWLVADRVEPDLLELGATWVPVHPPNQKINLVKSLQFSRLATRALRELAAPLDIVHGNGAVLNCRHQVNTAHFVHGAWRRSPVHTARLQRGLYGTYQWTYTTVNASQERQAYRRAGIVVAVSERVRRELVSIGVPEERTRVILNGVDVEEFHSGLLPRTEWGLPEGVPLLLFVGEIRTPRKNLETVLRALVRLPEVHLAVVGEVAESPFPALAAALGVAGRVHFLGYRHDVARVMRAVDTFVFPSRYEACSLVLLEALASGLPVVTTETAGGAEIVTPDCGVVLKDPNDVASLADAVRRLLAHPEKLREMGRAARRIAEEHSWEHMADEYRRLYETVCRETAA